MGATAAIGTLVGGTALSSFANMKAGREQQKMFEKNAGFADWQAEDATTRGKVNEKRQRQATEGVIGAQRVSLATQGVDVNLGSSLDVQADAAYLGELDALTIRSNAAKESYGFKVQAEDYRQRGKYAKQEGDMNAVQTIIGGGSSLLLAKYGGGPYTISNAGGFANPGVKR